MGRKSPRRSKSRSISERGAKNHKRDRSRDKRRGENREKPSISRKKSRPSKKAAKIEQPAEESPPAKRKRRSCSRNDRKERPRLDKKIKRSTSDQMQEKPTARDSRKEKPTARDSRKEKPTARDSRKEKPTARDSREEETRGLRDDKREGGGQKSPSGDQLRGAKPQSYESWGTTKDAIENVEEEDERPKEAANFEVSGLLALEDNSRNDIPLKYTEPPDACVPLTKWRFYIFKKGEEQKIVHLHRQAGFLFGKERRVADIATDHCTCSKQHAVMHFRQKGEDVLPYIMDLESTNGTFLNGKLIEPARYVEMKHKDVVRFGSSTRELVLINADK